MAEWITANTTLKKRPFTFDRYPFQRAIANDMHPNLSVQKASQVGLTEIQVRKFFAMLTRGTSLNGIFTLPNEKMYKRIYSGRMAPIIAADLIFNPSFDTKPVRRNDLIQIRDSFGYITGCTEGDATSISADFLMHDELDLSPQQIIGLFPSRLQGSELGVTQSFSTPSYFDFGISRAFNLSDQHQYLCRCDGCNHWNLPKFDTTFVQIPDLPHDLENLTDLTAEQIGHLDFSGAAVLCERCRRPLDLGRAGNREWVATYPGRVNNRGYMVHPFSTGRISIGHILGRLAKARDDENVRGFHNTVLGQPFTESSAQIQRSDVEQVLSPLGNVPDIGSRPAYLGIDMGQTCWLVVTSPNDQDTYDFVFWDTCHASVVGERVAELRRKYNIVQGLVDREPYTPDADEMRERSGSVIMPAKYGSTAVITRHKDEEGNVDYYRINRTHALDRVKTTIMEKTTVIAGYGPHRETIITHLGDMVRAEEAEEEAVWKKLHGNDHFFHAAALALLAPRINEDLYQNQPNRIGSLIMVKAADWMTSTLKNNNLGPQGRRNHDRAGLI